MAMSEVVEGKLNSTCIGSQWVCKLHFPCHRPKRPKAAMKPLLVEVMINGLPAVALFDMGSTTDAVSPEFT